MVDLIAESSFNASKVESQLRNKWDHKRKRCERGTQGLEAHGKEMDFFSVFSVYYVGKILTLFFFFLVKRSEETAQLEAQGIRQVGG